MVHAGITPAVENSKDRHLGAVDEEVHKVWKATQHHPTNVTVDARVNPWIVGKALEQVGNCAAKLGTKTRPLFVVPVLGLFEIAFSETSNDDVVLHRLRRRSATSLHGDSAAGFFCRSSNR